MTDYEKWMLLSMAHLLLEVSEGNPNTIQFVEKLRKAVAKTNEASEADIIRATAHEH